MKIQRTKLRPGERFHRLVVVRRSHRDKAKRRTYYLCRCDCGRATLSLAFKLIGGAKKSCGCLAEERKGRDHSRDGRRRTRTSYDAMIERCYNARHKKFYQYGGRGITVCGAWRASFETFLADMGERPLGTTIGRRENARGYEPDNCRWETHVQQQENRRTTIWVMISGGRESLAAACRRLGLNRNVIYGRLKMGWSEQDAFTKPVKPKRPNRNKSVPPPF